MLPSEGLLYFFWNEDDGYSKRFVFYHSSDGSDLRQARLPTGYRKVRDPDYQRVDPEVIYNPYTIRCAGTVSFLSHTRTNSRLFWPDATDDEIDAYFQLKDHFCLERRDRGNGVSTLFGFPQDPDDGPDEETADGWVLLLELGSDVDVGMCFYDAGELRYFIRKPDLAKRRFDRIYASITSG